MTQETLDRHEKDKLAAEVGQEDRDKTSDLSQHSMSEHVEQANTEVIEVESSTSAEDVQPASETTTQVTVTIPGLVGEEETFVKQRTPATVSEWLSPQGDDQATPSGDESPRGLTAEQAKAASVKIVEVKKGVASSAGQPEIPENLTESVLGSPLQPITAEQSESVTQSSSLQPHPQLGYIVQSSAPPSGDVDLDLGVLQMNSPKMDVRDEDEELRSDTTDHDSSRDRVDLTNDGLEGDENHPIPVPESRESPANSTVGTDVVESDPSRPSQASEQVQVTVINPSDSSTKEAGGSVNPFASGTSQYISGKYFLPSPPPQSQANHKRAAAKRLLYLSRTHICMASFQRLYDSDIGKPSIHIPSKLPEYTKISNTKELPPIILDYDDMSLLYLAGGDPIKLGIPDGRHFDLVTLDEPHPSGWSDVAAANEAMRESEWIRIRITSPADYPNRNLYDDKEICLTEVPESLQIPSTEPGIYNMHMGMDSFTTFIPVEFNYMHRFNMDEATLKNLNFPNGMHMPDMRCLCNFNIPLHGMASDLRTPGTSPSHEPMLATMFMGDSPPPLESESGSEDEESVTGGNTRDGNKSNPHEDSGDELETDAKQAAADDSHESSDENSEDDQKESGDEHEEMDTSSHQSLPGAEAYKKHKAGQKTVRVQKDAAEKTVKTLDDFLNEKPSEKQLRQHFKLPLTRLLRVNFDRSSLVDMQDKYVNQLMKIDFPIDDIIHLIGHHGNDCWHDRTLESCVPFVSGMTCPLKNCPLGDKPLHTKMEMFGHWKLFHRTNGASFLYCKRCHIFNDRWSLAKGHMWKCYRQNDRKRNWGEEDACLKNPPQEYIDLMAERYKMMWFPMFQTPDIVCPEDATVVTTPRGGKRVTSKKHHAWIWLNTSIKDPRLPTKYEACPRPGTSDWSICHTKGYKHYGDMYDAGETLTDLDYNSEVKFSKPKDAKPKPKKRNRSTSVDGRNKSSEPSDKKKKDDEESKDETSSTKKPPKKAKSGKTKKKKGKAKQKATSVVDDTEEDNMEQGEQDSHNVDESPPDDQEQSAQETQRDQTKPTTPSERESRSVRRSRRKSEFDDPSPPPMAKIHGTPTYPLGADGDEFISYIEYQTGVHGYQNGTQFAYDLFTELDVMIFLQFKVLEQPALSSILKKKYQGTILRLRLDKKIIELCYKLHDKEHKTVDRNSFIPESSITRKFAMTKLNKFEKMQVPELGESRHKYSAKDLTFLKTFSHDVDGMGPGWTKQCTAGMKKEYLKWNNDTFDKWRAKLDQKAKETPPDTASYGGEDFHMKETTSSAPESSGITSKESTELKKQVVQKKIPGGEKQSTTASNPITSKAGDGNKGDNPKPKGGKGKDASLPPKQTIVKQAEATKRAPIQKPQGAEGGKSYSEVAEGAKQVGTTGRTTLPSVDMTGVSSIRSPDGKNLSPKDFTNRNVSVNLGASVSLPTGVNKIDHPKSSSDGSNVKSKGQLPAGPAQPKPAQPGSSSASQPLANIRLGNHSYDPNFALDAGRNMVADHLRGSVSLARSWEDNLSASLSAVAGFGYAFRGVAQSLTNQVDMLTNQLAAQKKIISNGAEELQKVNNNLAYITHRRNCYKRDYESQKKLSGEYIVENERLKVTNERQAAEIEALKSQIQTLQQNLSSEMDTSERTGESSTGRDSASSLIDPTQWDSDTVSNVLGDMNAVSLTNPINHTGRSGTTALASPPVEFPLWFPGEYSWVVRPTGSRIAATTCISEMQKQLDEWKKYLASNVKGFKP